MVFKHIIDHFFVFQAYFIPFNAQSQSFEHL